MSRRVRTVAEFRIPERLASEYLAGDPGRVLGGSVRLVETEAEAPLYERVGNAHRALRAQGGSFFYGWELRHEATPEEAQAARLFHVRFTAAFEPAGEESGTRYDESTACPACGAGRTVVPPMRLNLRKVPKRADIAATIARDEWVVSERVKELMDEIGATGAELEEVEHTGRSAPPGRWYHLRVTAAPIRVVPPTRFGIDPFDSDESGRFECPACATAGFAVTSRVWVSAETWDGSDFIVSRERVGLTKGLVRPAPLLFISARVRRAFDAAGIRGARAEVVEVVV